MCCIIISVNLTWYVAVTRAIVAIYLWLILKHMTIWTDIGAAMDGRIRSLWAWQQQYTRNCWRSWCLYCAFFPLVSFILTSIQKDFCNCFFYLHDETCFVLHFSRIFWTILVNIHMSPFSVKNSFINSWFVWKAGLVITFYGVVWASSIHYHLCIAIPLPDWNDAAIKSTSNNHQFEPYISWFRPLRGVATGDTRSSMHPSCCVEWCHIGGIHGRSYTHAGSLICVERIFSQVWTSALLQYNISF